MNQGVLSEDLFGVITKAFMDSEILYYADIPVAKHFVKKNNRPIFRNKAKAFLGKSKELRDAEEHLHLHFRSWANKQDLEEPIEGPLWIVMLFYFLESDMITKKNTLSKTRPDLSNLYELPQDCLQYAGVIKDDNQICSHDLSRRLIGPERKLRVYLLRHQFDFRPKDDE